MSNYGRVGMSKSPPKQSVKSPKSRTAPSQLDFTQCSPMQYPGPLSPQKLSPMRPRTMKEYEEELSSLKKENFNLKLRIYFTEERRKQEIGTEDEDLLKTNTELRVQLDCLQREVSEKDELVMKANKALHMLKEDYTNDLSNMRKHHNGEIEILQEKIDKLEKQIQEQQNMTFLESTTRFEDSSAMYTAAFALNGRSELDGRLRTLECDLMSEREKSRSLEEHITKLKSHNSEMQQRLNTFAVQLESTKTRLQNAYADIENKAETISAFNLRLHALDLTIGKHEKNLALKNEELNQKERMLSELNTKISTLEKQLGEFHSTKSKEKNASKNFEAEYEATLQENLKLKQELNHLRQSQDSTPRRSVRDRSLGRRSADSQERDLIKQLKESHLKFDKLEDQFRILQAKLRDTQKTCAEKDQRLARFEEDYRKACNCLQGVIKNNKQLTRENHELRGKRDVMMDNQTTPQLRVTSPSAQNELQLQLKEMSERLTNEVNEKDKSNSEKDIKLQVLMSELKEKELKLKEYEVKMSLLTDLESKDNCIAKLEIELEDLKSQLDNVKKEDQEEKKYVLEELEVKKKQIEQLKTELKKRTFNLQELVNHELWDKNREIEKLNKLCERRQIEVMSLKQQINARDFQLSILQDKVKELGLNQLGSSLVMREIQTGLLNEESKENAVPEDVIMLREQLKNNVEEKRLLSRKVEELKERLRNTPERDSESRLVQSLKSQLATSKQETEQAEKSKKELMNVCTLLTTRLQELADFLDSLLPSLGAKKRRIVEQAVQRSRELSRSFTMAADESTLHSSSAWLDLQPSLYAPLLPDFSTVDFWSGDEVIESLEEDLNEEPELVRLRSQVEILTQEVKQKDGELAKIHSENSAKQNSLSKNSFQSVSIWGLNCFDPTIDSRQNEEDLINLASMCDNIAINDITEGSLLATCSERNSPDKAFAGTAPPSVKSSNIGTIICTSRKKDTLVKMVGEGDEKKSNSGCLSESEAWSEPDRDVSKDRIGLKEDKTLTPRPLSWLHEDSSDTTETTPRSSSGGKRMSELRKLQSRVRALEEMNEALRGELTILHQLAPPSLVQPNMEDKSTSIELSADTSLSVPLHLLEEIRRQREKLEASLFHNDYIRRQLEGGLSTLKRGQIHSESIDNTLRLKLNDLTVQLEKAKSRCQELETQEKDTQDKWEKEQGEWKNKANELQLQINELKNVLQEKTNEVLEKNCSLLEVENQSKQQSLEYEQKLNEVNKILLEEKTQVDTLLKKIEELEEERKQLVVTLDASEENVTKMKQEIEEYQIKEKKNKQVHEELNSKLQATMEEKSRAETEASEFKQKWEVCQHEAENKISEVQTKLAEAEKASVELEAGLRVQLEAATKQCSHFEMKLKDLDNEHKLHEAEWREAERRHLAREAEWRRRLDLATLNASESELQRTRLVNDKLRLQQEIRRRDDNPHYTHLEKMKLELERRVAELEAANNELETRLSNLHVMKPAFSDYDTEDGTSSVPGSPRRTQWVLGEPGSPTIKPVSPLALRPRYTPQRSHDLTSDYLSDQDTGPASSQVNIGTSNPWFPTSPRSNISASPDLGIESDQGRFSSLETNSNLPSQGKALTISIRPTNGELSKLEEENCELRHHLMKTRQALEETLAQLTASNQKKKKVERAICKQLQKTHSILKKARVNLENEDAEDAC